MQFVILDVHVNKNVSRWIMTVICLALYLGFYHFKVSIRFCTGIVYETY